MNRIDCRVWTIALAALLASGCGGRTIMASSGGGNDAGPHDAGQHDAGQHDAGQHDAATDAPDGAARRVSEACQCDTSYSAGEKPPLPGYPYVYSCAYRTSDPDCVQADDLPQCPCGYYCKSPPAPGNPPCIISR